MINKVGTEVPGSDTKEPVLPKEYEIIDGSLTIIKTDDKNDFCHYFNKFKKNAQYLPRTITVTKSRR